MANGVPPLAGRLIDTLIRDNTSGAIRTAPHSLRNLKDSIKGVPFLLNQPGMSGVLKAANLLSVVQQLAGMRGLSLNQLGSFQSILSQIASGTATAQQIIAAMGAGQSLGAALLGYGGAASAVSKTASGTSNPSTTGVEAGTSTGGNATA